MTTRKAFGAFAVAAAVAVMIACSPSSRNNGAAITLTGCLQPGDTPGTFLLTSTGKPNTSVGTSGAREPSGDEHNPTGSPAQSNSSDIGSATTKVYTLVPSQTVDLSKNQGTVVRITGRFENRQGATGTTGSEANGANPATGEGPQSSTRGAEANRQMETIHVDSVQQLAATCGGGNR